MLAGVDAAVTAEIAALLYGIWQGKDLQGAWNVFAKLSGMTSHKRTQSSAFASLESAMQSSEAVWDEAGGVKRLHPCLSRFLTSVIAAHGATAVGAHHRFLHALSLVFTDASLAALWGQPWGVHSHGP